MNLPSWLRLSLSLTIMLAVYGCHNDPQIAEETPLEKASIPCKFIQETAGYVDCIYQMNPDTQFLQLEPNEPGIPDLTRFTKLTTLRITSNGSYSMSVLNPEIVKLKSLKHLIISKSFLAHLPEDIVRLENLETLTVTAGWSLKTLPDNLSQLKHLRVLNLWRNNLDGDSLDFTGMDALELIVLGENDRVDLKKLKKKWPKLKIVDYCDDDS